MVQRVSPDYLWLRDLASAFWGARALHAAVRLGLFAHLRGRWLPARDALRRLHLPARSGVILLDACVALGLLRKRRDRYRNSAIAERFLVPGQPDDIIPGLALADEGYAAWARLPESIQQNRPVFDRFRNPPTRLIRRRRMATQRPSGPQVGWGDEPSVSSERFTLAMDVFGRYAAPALAGAVDLRRRYRLLDIGGGSGINTLTLVQHCPWLQAVVLDRPEVCATAKRLLHGKSGATRIQLLPGDYHEPLPAGFDCALLSHILHAEPPRECQRLLARVADALEPNGLLLIVDFLTDPSRTRPLFAALFALNMLLQTAQGQTYTVREMRRWVAQVGFRRVRLRPLTGTWAHLLTAIKK